MNKQNEGSKVTFSDGFEVPLRQAIAAVFDYWFFGSWPCNPESRAVFNTPYADSFMDRPRRYREVCDLLGDDRLSEIRQDVNELQEWHDRESSTTLEKKLLRRKKTGSLREEVALYAAYVTGSCFGDLDPRVEEARKDVLAGGPAYLYYLRQFRDHEKWQDSNAV